jgi:Holliday junction resolvase RusA-like endonuclease
MSTTITISMPPSVNALWRAHRKGVHRSRRYLAWLKEAGWELKTQRPKHFTGAVTVAVAIGRPDQRRRDLDNVATKALLDLLVAHQVIEDDSKVASLAARWDSTVPAGVVHVSIEHALVA